ncbi:MAG: glycosyl transferase group 1 [Bacteroidetes bacterium]|jgi:glycosyltransferase involved in cell wall biosynthesis|nr:glycosyl transferase group 1 [Bacteroidota bacterium]
MPKILFIAAHRPDRSPSQRYRFEQYFSFLEANGYSCELSYIIDAEADALFYRPGHLFRKLIITLKSLQKRMKDVRKAHKYDIVFVQREAFMTGSAYFEKRFSKSKAKLVFDFDDSIWLLDTSKANKKWAWLKSEKKTGEIIRVSDLIFAGNRYLANYALQFNSNVHIIPTTIDTNIFKRSFPYTEKEKICIGWSGSITTIKHFEQALPYLKAIKQKYGNKVFFKVMGDKTYINRELGIRGIEWNSNNEVNVLESFDIGIMPLPDDEWVKGKCGLKGLSYMSVEVPTVMSAVGVNTEIINDGVNGFLAKTDNEWIEKLSLLIDSFELRKEIGRNGRKTVSEHYSFDSQKNVYLRHFNEILNR